ncbi:MAG: hypothetical protein VW882_09020 [Gammaproteobacteria bacterium]
MNRHYEVTSSDYVRIDTDTYPRGVDAELFTFAMLIEANETADTSFEQEHVTPYFYQSGRYRVSHLKNPRGNHASYRLCVDEMADFECVTEIIRNLGDNWATATYEDIIHVLQAHPDIANINGTVKQRYSLTRLADYCKGSNSSQALTKSRTLTSASASESTCLSLC